MKLLSTLCVISAVLASSNAMADGPHLTYRVEPGIAAPLSSPQSNLYGVGGAVTGKVAVNLTKWFDVDPSVSMIVLSSKSGYSVGGTEAFGLGARIHRPHDVPRDSYWHEASPWVDADIQYFNTGGLNRLGASVGVGVAFPTNEETRHLFLGPYARYTNITDGTSVGGSSGKFDRNDARIFVVGLSFEFDFASHKKNAAAVKPEPTKDVPEVVARVEAKPDMPAPKMVPAEETFTAEDRIHFDFDSAVIHKNDTLILDMIAENIKNHLVADSRDPLARHLKHVQVDGHASSENHPWAEKHNQTLSEKRAEAVVDYLVSKGVPREMVSAKGFGTGTPSVDNTTEKMRSANRRVEFEVTISFLKEEGQ